MHLLAPEFLWLDAMPAAGADTAGCAGLRQVRDPEARTA